MSRNASQKRLSEKAEPGASGNGSNLHDPALYINRELSLLAFQRRVLEEAEDPTNPLLERVKFLSILGSNIDEFFMVRVAGLAAQLEAGTLDVGPDRMTPRAQLVSIRREIKKLYGEAHRCLDELHPELVKNGIVVHEYAKLSDGHQNLAGKYFSETIFPVLTPLAFDPGRPFPHISNLSLNLAVLIRDRDGSEHFARVKVPDSLPQLVPLTGVRPGRRSKAAASSRVDMVWLEEIIAAHLSELFPGTRILEAHPFHVTRDADIAIRELEAEDLLETIEEGVRHRRFGSVIRLVVTRDMPSAILDILMENLEIESANVYRTERPLSLRRLDALYALNRPELKFAPFVAAVPEPLVAGQEEDLFTTVRQQTVLLHHPFDSFQPVIDFLKHAARDPSVLAIKMCLYRVGRNSPIVDALLEAVEEDKQVAVLVELKARFDEESNIEWARALESAGAHVVYGLVGLKIHCKVALVVRREQDRIARYVHISTGNYNSVTAHLYTDAAILTADEDIAADAGDLLNYLTGYSHKTDYRRLLVAPVNLRSRVESLIERETQHAKKGRPAHLILKINALVDPPIIRALYRASQAGVKVQLLVRGICCLRPGVPGVSDRIEVISIVGRFLEHSRIFYFRNGGEEEVYIGSADLMPRNIDHRVEILAPILDPKAIRHLYDDVLTVYLSDNVKARRMQPNGTYQKKRAKDASPVSAQDLLIQVRRARSQRQGPSHPKPRPHVRSD